MSTIAWFLAASLSASQPVGLGADAPSGNAPSVNNKNEVPLPKGTAVTLQTLEVSPGGERAVCVHVDVGGEPHKPEMRFKAMLVGLRTGKTTNMSTFVPELAAKTTRYASVNISSDGNHVLVAVTSEKGTNLSILDVHAQRTKRLAMNYRGSAIWFGRRIAVSGFDTGSLAPIELKSPSDGNSQILPIRGMVVCADPNGTMLVVAGDPANPGRQMDMHNLEKKASLLTLDAQGQVLRTLGPMNVVSSRPILSSGGKFLAHQARRAGSSERPRAKYSMRVVSTDGKLEHTIKEFAMPLAVLDSGQVLGVPAVLGPEGAPLKMWDLKGNSRVLVRTVRDATVVGNRIYYATGGNKPAIKWMRLPESR